MTDAVVGDLWISRCIVRAGDVARAGEVMLGPTEKARVVPQVADRTFVATYRFGRVGLVLRSLARVGRPCQFALGRVVAALCQARCELVA